MGIADANTFWNATTATSTWPQTTLDAILEACQKIEDVPPPPQMPWTVRIGNHIHGQRSATSDRLMYVSAELLEMLRREFSELVTMPISGIGGIELQQVDWLPYRKERRDELQPTG